MIELILPYPPSLNHYKNIGRLTQTKTGKLYQQKINSPQTKRYMFEVWLMVQQKKAKEGLKSFDSEEISLEVYVHSPDKRKRDLDNILKVTIDSLENAGLFNDDSQICRLIVERREIIKNGQLIVRLCPYGKR